MGYRLNFTGGCDNVGSNFGMRIMSMWAASQLRSWARDKEMGLGGQCK